MFSLLRITVVIWIACELFHKPVYAWQFKSDCWPSKKMTTPLELLKSFSWWDKIRCKMLSTHHKVYEKIDFVSLWALLLICRQCIWHKTCEIWNFWAHVFGSVLLTTEQSWKKMPAIFFPHGPWHVFISTSVPISLCLYVLCQGCDAARNSWWRWCVARMQGTKQEAGRLVSIPPNFLCTLYLFQEYLSR